MTISSATVLYPPQTGEMLLRPRLSPFQAFSAGAEVSSVVRATPQAPAPLAEKAGHTPDDGHGHGAPVSPWKNLASAAGFLGAALLLRRLPARPTSFKLFSSDWKDWAKLGLGVVSLNKINQAFRYEPPPWLNAIQTVGVVTPLMLGFKKPALLQMAVLAPLVGALVQGTHWLSERSEGWLEDKAGVPAMVTRVAIAAAMVVLGLRTLPPMLGQVNAWGREGHFGQGMANAIRQEQAASHSAKANTQAAGISTICARCGGAHAICMSEIADFFGALGNWFRNSSKSSS